MMPTSMSIRWKVILGITVTSTLSILFASAIFATLEVGRLHQTLERETRTVAELIGTTNVGALEFDDPDAAADTIGALRSSPQVIDAVIYDAGGEAFAWYRRRGESVRTGPGDSLPSGLPARVPNRGLAQDETSVAITLPIEYEGDRSGSVYLVSSTAGIDAARASLFSSTLVIVLCSLLLAAAIAWLIQAAILGPLRAIVAAMQDIAEGDSDLTHRLDDSGRDEIGDLARGFNAFVGRIHSTISHASDSADQLTRSAAATREISSRNSASATMQQDEIQQVATALNEMASTVQEVASNVAQAADNATNADAESKAGRAVVAETMEAIRSLANDIGRASDVIERLQQDSENIGSVLDVIRGIAEQTNLLALNAAIEAARAGEQGRGFAVVADEVRTLASRTQSSTEEIHGMIERLQHGSREAVEAMSEGRRQAHESVNKAERASQSLGAITQAVDSIRDMTAQIATASREQSQVTDEINARIANISQVATSTASGAQENSERSTEMAALSSDLLHTVNQFRL